MTICLLDGAQTHSPANTVMTNFKHVLQFLGDLKAVPALDFNKCSLEAAAYQSDTNCAVNRLRRS